MASQLALPGGDTKDFATQQELDAYLAEICEAVEKQECFHFTGDSNPSVQWTMLPNGVILYAQPV